jgi:hypothetical protein
VQSLTQPVTSTVKGVGSLIQANNGQTPPSDPNPLVEANNGNPPTTGASPVTPAVPVCDPPVCTMVPGSPGAPSTAILSSGSSDSGSGGTNCQGSTSNVRFDTSNLESKLNGYLLDPAHPQNQTKANWFSQALGSTRATGKIWLNSCTLIPLRQCRRRLLNTDKLMSKSSQSRN